MQAKDCINVVLARKLVTRARIFILQREMGIPLKTFVEQAIEEKIARMEENS